MIEDGYVVYSQREKWFYSYLLFLVVLAQGCTQTPLMNVVADTLQTIVSDGVLSGKELLAVCECSRSL